DAIGRRTLIRMRAFDQISEPVVFPAHPRVRAAIARLGHVHAADVHVCEPAGYGDMIALQRNARVIATDSGGVQKEAYWLGVPCVTLRDETEWVETVANGWNVLTGADPARILSAARQAARPADRPPLCGEDDVVDKIVSVLGEGLGRR
ncbi:MAG: UDP-N-acetylglucosamine 2-epimerase, partial [Vicinamibacterales bacterium]